MRPFIDSALCIFAAMIAGALIGLNRDLHGKPTGARLHALVAIGAAAFTLAGTEMADKAAASRIIQGIVGGIGFLGAGVILRAESDGRIHNLTTAASVWVTAALGVACGIGAWWHVVLILAAVLIVLSLGLKIDRRLHDPRDDENLGSVDDREKRSHTAADR